MILDIYAALEIYLRRDISNICFVRSEKNFVDGLTETRNHTALIAALSSGNLSIHLGQAILRDRW